MRFITGDSDAWQAMFNRNVGPWNKLQQVDHSSFTKSMMMKKKESLPDIFLKTMSSLLQQEKKDVTSTGADFYKYGMQTLIHCLWKCITNGVDYMAENLFYPMM